MFVYTFGVYIILVNIIYGNSTSILLFGLLYNQCNKRGYKPMLICVFTDVQATKNAVASVSLVWALVTYYKALIR